MKATITATVLGGLFLVMALGVPVWARADADETQLETVKKEIDSNTTAPATGDKVKTLSTQFNVEPGVVENLRAKKQGWGETTIELAMAQHLTQTDAKTYPTMADALKKLKPSGARRWAGARSPRISASSSVPSSAPPCIPATNCGKNLAWKNHRVR